MQWGINTHAKKYDGRTSRPPLNLAKRLVYRKRGTLDLFCIRRLQAAGHQGRRSFGANLSDLIFAAFLSNSRIQAANLTYQNMAAVQQNDPLVVENMRAFKRRNVKVACVLCVLLIICRRDSS